MGDTRSVRPIDASIQTTMNELDSLGWWYQHFQLPNGIWTGDGGEPAYFPQRRWEMTEPFVPADLAGKTVLDMGGNAGYFSIQMKLRGAAQCLLVEPVREFVRQAEFAARQFQAEIEAVCEDAHTYCLTTVERFDYVLLLGLFYHLKYPGLVLNRAAEMTKERMLVATAVIGPEIERPVEKQDYERLTDDDLLLDPGFPKLAFVEGRYNNDPTNWWLPNYSALPTMMRSAGLRVIARPIGTFWSRSRNGTWARWCSKDWFSRATARGKATFFQGLRMWTGSCGRNLGRVRWGFGAGRGLNSACENFRATRETCPSLRGSSGKVKRGPARASEESRAGSADLWDSSCCRR